MDFPAEVGEVCLKKQQQQKPTIEETQTADITLFWTGFP